MNFRNFFILILCATYLNGTQDPSQSTASKITYQVIQQNDASFVEIGKNKDQLIRLRSICSLICNDQMKEAQEKLEELSKQTKNKNFVIDQLSSYDFVNRKSLTKKAFMSAFLAYVSMVCFWGCSIKTEITSSNWWFAGAILSEIFTTCSFMYLGKTVQDSVEYRKFKILAHRILLLLDQVDKTPPTKSAIVHKN